MRAVRVLRPLSVWYVIFPWAYSGGMADLDGVRLAVMAMAENMIPLHEMIAGEVAYFQRQGFTTEQAHALAAAEFVGVFGAAIRREASYPDDET